MLLHVMHADKEFGRKNTKGRILVKSPDTDVFPKTVSSQVLNDPLLSEILFVMKVTLFVVFSPQILWLVFHCTCRRHVQQYQLLKSKRVWKKEHEGSYTSKIP
jgi:hypothetical protein